METFPVLWQLGFVIGSSLDLLLAAVRLKIIIRGTVDSVEDSLKSEPVRDDFLISL